MLSRLTAGCSIIGIRKGRIPYKPSLALMISLVVGTPAWGVDCKQLQDQRDQLAQQAMAAEVALVHRQRQQLCPQLETLATGQIAELTPQLDYGAYIRCRQKAETELHTNRPVLYRNTAGFPYFTSEGARLAQDADGLKRALSENCAATKSPLR